MILIVIVLPMYLFIDINRAAVGKQFPVNLGLDILHYIILLEFLFQVIYLFSYLKSGDKVIDEYATIFF